ncbi:hypothetical protein JI667_05390 [Bacillus sp. NTK074B]|uniref:hypothetical protein n=1 Tax=Bacillus sp. NTK074B TaxID=2802174 RepID=UPI001A8E59E5|nr:hypothetical protein [Bacillus sp. NTK074B]
MKRFLITLCLMMILISSSILFFQWMGFTTESAGESGVVKVDQSYSIIHNEGIFMIEQTIQFPAGSSDPITIQWPEGSENFSCRDQGGKNCLTKENGEFQINAPKPVPQEITITYSIKQSPKSGYILLGSWFPVLSDVSTTSTDIQLTEKSLRRGEWIAGYQSKSFKKLDYIDYYSFRGKGGPSALLWTKDEWKEEEYSSVRVMSNDLNHSGLEEQLTSFDPDDGFVTVIITKNIKPFLSSHLIIMSDESSGEYMNNIRRSLLYQAMYSLDSETWLRELVVGLLLNEVPPTGKPAWAYKQLLDGLSLSDWENLRQMVKDPTIAKDHTIDHAFLDDAVSRVTGYTSTFFEENVNKDENKPFILKGNKPILVNQEPTQLSYVSNKQNEFIQFPEAVKDLGIEMKEVEPGEYFTSLNGNTLRFYVNEDFFIYNEEIYGSLVKPVQTIGGPVYIDIHLLKKLFKVDVQEEDDVIRIST